ncbi:hypothetical protein F5141DRAFT_1060666 [Pisolithus sp. B1]|nr:hypothetical protein F5141DRAFT_1060666 [Pisolithus sp. B1]
MSQGKGQIKLAVFETAPGDGKKVFTESSQSSKDWVLTAESLLTDYLLTDHVEEDSAEKQEVEISLDEDGNPEVPTWGGQKLKVQQNLARAVFQAAYAACLMEVWEIAKFTKKPKAKVPWGLLIKSPMEYLDSESIPEGFTMKDPSKWTKAYLGLLWDHWQSLEAEEKVIVSFIDCKKEDAPLSRQFDRKVVGSSKKRVWVTVEDDSEAEVGGAGIPGPSATHHSVGGPSEQTVDDGTKYLLTCSSSRGLEVVLGLGLLLRECSHAQEVEEDDPLRGDDVMDVVRVVVSRLEQCPAGTKGPQVGDGGARMGERDGGDEEKEEEEEEAPTRKRKRAGSGIVTRGQKMAKKDEGKGKKVGESQRKGVRTWNQTKRAM